LRSLVLLAGGTDVEGLRFLAENPRLPVFAAAAADDAFGADWPQTMQWLADLSGNPRNEFAGFADGGHGTEIFGPHPELVGRIVDWYVKTLVAPADEGAGAAVRKAAAAQVWALLDRPEGPGRVAGMLQEARRADPQANLFPQDVLNQLVYAALQAGRNDHAVSLAQLNVEAYPGSANVHDTLADAHLAAGQREHALRAAEKALALLPAEKMDAARRKAIQDSAEEKVKRLRPPARP
jgi:hypothetical protein